MYVTKLDCDSNFAYFLYTFFSFEVVLASKDIMAAFVNILVVHIIHGSFSNVPKFIQT